MLVCFAVVMGQCRQEGHLSTSEWDVRLAAHGIEGQCRQEGHLSTSERDVRLAAHGIEGQCRQKTICRLLKGMCAWRRGEEIMDKQAVRKDIMRSYTAQDHKKRLLNIQEARRQVVSCRKEEMLMNFEPGHFVYPGIGPGDPEEDAALFGRLSEAGVKYIYTWSFWTGIENRWNGDPMFIPKEPDKVKAFLDLAHQYGLKVLPYTSTNFFNRNSPYFNPDWAYSPSYDLNHKPYDAEMLTLAHCSPNSPGWRAHLLRQYVNLLDSYDYDGLYIDTGYIRRCDYISAWQYYEEEPVMVKDEIMAFPENEKHDGGLEDLLSIIHAEVKRRGKTLTVFKEGTDRVRSDRDLYDYMFAGECATDIDFVRRRIRDYKHVLLDFSPAQAMDEQEYYLNSVPFLQVPLLKQFPITLDDATAIIPDFEYGLKWVPLLKAMTEDGTQCYIDADCPRLVRRKGEETVCSLFLNRDSYLVLANFGHKEDEVELSGSYRRVALDGEEEPCPEKFLLKGRELLILKKA